MHHRRLLIGCRGGNRANPLNGDLAKVRAIAGSRELTKLTPPFDKLDAILQAETDDMFELAKMAGLSEQQILSLYKEVDLKDVDVRNQDLTDFDLAGSDFTGVIANSFTEVDLENQYKSQFFEAASKFHMERLVHHGCLDLYHFDELVRLRAKESKEALLNFVESWSGVVLHDVDYLYDDIFQRVSLREGSFFPILFAAMEDTAPWAQRMRRNESHSESIFYNEIADQIIYASNHELLKDFDTATVRGDLVRFLEKNQLKRRNNSGRFSDKYDGFYTVLRTLPAYSIKLNVEITTESNGNIYIDRVWSELLPAKFKLNRAETHYRLDSEFYGGGRVSVPAVMRKFPAYLTVSDDYDYDSARFAPLPEI